MLSLPFVRVLPRENRGLLTYGSRKLTDLRLVQNPSIDDRGAVFRLPTCCLVGADNLPVILDTVRILATMPECFSSRALAANGFASGVFAATGSYRITATTGP